MNKINEFIAEVKLVTNPPSVLNPMGERKDVLAAESSQRRSVKSAFREQQFKAMKDFAVTAYGEFQKLDNPSKLAMVLLGMTGVMCFGRAVDSLLDLMGSLPTEGQIFFAVAVMLLFYTRF